MSVGGLMMLALAAGLWSAATPSLILRGMGLAVIVAIAGHPLPAVLWLGFLAADRQRHRRPRGPDDDELADLLQTWQARLRAGMDIGSALADPDAVPNGSPTDVWLRPLREGLLAGRPLSDAIARLDPQALPIPLRPAWTGLCSRIAGGLPVGDSIADLATELRAHHARRLETFARTAPLRMLIPQWLLFLGVFAAALLPVLLAQADI